jgi:hypothetical protein
MGKLGSLLSIAQALHQAKLQAVQTKLGGLSALTGRKLLHDD